MSHGMGSDGDFEYGRPRYQPPPAPDSGRPRRLGDGPARDGAGDDKPVLALSAVVALLIGIAALLLPLVDFVRELRSSPLSLVGYVLPLIGGLYAVRRGTRAAQKIESASGALSGIAVALWARRVGWFTVLVSVLLMFWHYGGALIGKSYSSS